MLEFANDGGPMMVAPRSPAPLWEGGEHPSGGRAVDAQFRWAGDGTPATDYDRACDVEDGAALLTAGPGWVLVLNGELGGAGWLPLSNEPASAAIVGASGGFDESLAELHAQFASGAWTSLTESLPIGAGGVFLMHASGIPGDEDEVAYDNEGRASSPCIGDAIVYPLPAGTYRAELLEHVRRRTATTPGGYVVVVRLTRVGEPHASAAEDAAN